MNGLPRLGSGDEVRFEAGGRVYYGLVLEAMPFRVRIRVRKGGPFGSLVADLAFGHHPTIRELEKAVAG